MILDGLCRFDHRFYSTMACPVVPFLQQFLKDLGRPWVVYLRKGFSDMICPHGFGIQHREFDVIKFHPLLLTEILLIGEEQIP